MDILKRLYPEPEPSPYDDLVLSDHPDDLQGWASKDPLFEEIISKVKPKLIVEVGSWKGASAVHMAQLLRTHSPPEARIVCVDTWLGSPEHFMHPENPERRPSLRLKNGYPQLYYTFLCNMARQKVSDIVIPLPQPSLNAALILKGLGLRPDLVYIDAAHEYAAVMQDLDVYWPLVSDQGVLLGDDFISHRGVTEAVYDFAVRHNIHHRLVGRYGKFILSKNKDIQPRVVMG